MVFQIARRPCPAALLLWNVKSLCGHPYIWPVMAGISKHCKLYYTLNMEDCTVPFAISGCSTGITYPPLNSTSHPAHLKIPPVSFVVSFSNLRQELPTARGSEKTKCGLSGKFVFFFSAKMCVVLTWQGWIPLVLSEVKREHLFTIWALWASWS